MAGLREFILHIIYIFISILPAPKVEQTALKDLKESPVNRQNCFLPQRTTVLLLSSTSKPRPFYFYSYFLENQLFLHSSSKSARLVQPNQHWFIPMEGNARQHAPMDRQKTKLWVFRIKAENDVLHFTLPLVAASKINPWNRRDAGIWHVQLFFRPSGWVERPLVLWLGKHWMLMPVAHWNSN